MTDITLSSALKLAAATAATTAVAVTCWRSRPEASEAPRPERRRPERRRRPEARRQFEWPAETLLRLTEEAREDLHAAQEKYRAVREAEEAALPQDERDFRALYPPYHWGRP